MSSSVKRLLVIEDLIHSSEKICSYLQTKGYQTVLVKTEKDLLPLDIFSFHGLFHFAQGKHELNQRLIQKIQGSFYNEFPILVVSHQRPECKYAKHQQKYWIKSLSSLEQTERAVWKALKERKSKLRSQQLQERLNLHQELVTLSRSLELEDLVSATLDVSQKLFQSENVFFFKTEAIDIYAHELWKQKETAQHESSLKTNIWTHAHIEASTLSTLFQAILAKQNLFFDQVATPISHVKLDSGKEVLLFQIPSAGGHLLLINPKKLREVRYRIGLKSIQMEFNQLLHIGASFDNAKSLAYIDDLTGLFNSRYMSKALETEVNRCQRTGDHFSVLFLDVDHLKKINSQFGHLAGSRILAEFGKVIKTCVRNVDSVFRYGGDEFLILLVGAEKATAERVAERIRNSIEKVRVPFQNSELSATVSIGVATYPDHANNAEAMIRIADQAMFCGKNKSRNTVFVAS